MANSYFRHPNQIIVMLVMVLWLYFNIHFKVDPIPMKRKGDIKYVPD